LSVWPFVHFSSFLVYVGLAVYIILKNPKSSLHRVAALLIGCFALWSLAQVFIHNPASSQALAHFWQNISSLGWISLSSVVLWFFLVFSQKNKVLRWRPFYFLLFAVPCLLIYGQWSGGLVSDGVRHFYGWGTVWARTFWVYVYLAYFITYTTISLFILIAFWKRTLDPARKRQARIILIPALITILVAALTNFVLPMLHIYIIPDLADVAGLLVLGVLGFGMAKYDFLALTTPVAAKEIVSRITDSLFLIDPLGKIVTANKGAEQLLEYAPNELSGKPFEFILADSRLRADMFCRIGRGEESFSSQAVFISRKGKHVPVLLTCSALARESNDLFGIICTARDITEQKKTQEALRESEERYSLVTKQTGQLIYDYDTETGKIIWAGAIEEVMGYRPEEFQADIEEWADRIHPEERERNVLLLGEARETGRRYSTEYRFRVKDNQYRYIRDTGIFLSDESGKPNRMLGIMTDVSKQKAVENELQSAKEAAESANRAKSGFLANMSHELRTPLNAIIGFSEVLNDRFFGPLNQKQQEYVTDIMDSGKHLLTLINDILDLTKIEVGKFEAEISDVRIADLLRNSLTMIKEKCLKHQIAMELTVSPETEALQIPADERRIKQVLVNLLTNASKFTPDGGRIEISARKNGRELLISVSDTGIGIAAEHQERIFDRFYQVQSGMRDKTPGAGLGLNLSKQIVEMHGGKLWVESDGIGKGSRFSFVLPLRRGNA